MKARAAVEGAALGEMYTRAFLRLADEQERPRYLFATPLGSPMVQISCSAIVLVRARELAKELRGSMAALFLTAAVGYLDRLAQQAA